MTPKSGFWIKIAFFTLFAVSLLIMVNRFRENTPEPEVELSPKMQAARNKAMVLCAGCHGPEGIGTAEFNPNLACQKQVYMAKQLRDYREGHRNNHIPMVNIAKMLTEDEVDDISLWYSRQNCPEKQ